MLSYKTATIVSLVTLCALAGASFFSITSLQEQRSNLERTLHSTRASLAEARQTITELEEELSKAQEENRALREDFEAEKRRMDAFNQQIEEVTGAVGTLEKLRSLDTELLQKYSRTSFLNEHYVPSDLSEIDADVLLEPDRERLIHTQVKPYLMEMIEDAERDGVTLQVASAYRSFDEQSQLHSHYQTTFGEGVNQFSADQGFSEHQLGTAVDFTTPETPGVFSGFDDSDAYRWLEENAYRYGFVLSYPQDNPYYIFEPWHWRFVGVRLATDLHENDIRFYDMPQREIDQYLLYIFD